MSAALHKSRLASALVSAQISLSLLLLICAGLFIRSLQNAERQDPGFAPDHVLLASYALEPAGYSREQGIAFDRQLISAHRKRANHKPYSIVSFRRPKQD